MGLRCLCCSKYINMAKLFVYNPDDIASEKGRITTRKLAKLCKKICADRKDFIRVTTQTSEVTTDAATSITTIVFKYKINHMV